MRIEQKSVDSLFPADYNPRKALKPGNPEYEKLKRSIEQFGLVEPLIWNERSGRLVGGHQRLTVLQNMGVHDVEVSIVDLDEAHEKALNVALNKISGDWDAGKLKELLSSLDADLSALTGFDEVEIEALLGEKKSGAAKAGNADLSGQAVSRRGDVWLLGEHRLMCGDSCSAADVDTLMDGAQARLCITDPPYNVNYEDKTGALEEYLGSQNRETSRILNDCMDDESFRAFLLAAYTQMYRAMEPGASIYVFHADTEGINFRTQFRAAGFKLSECLVWVKSSIVLGRQDYQWRHEPILYGWKDGGSHHWYGGRKRYTVQDEGKPCVTVQHMPDGDVLAFSDGYNHYVVKAKQYEVLDDGHDDTMSVLYCEKPAANDLHPTMKPVELVARLMRNSSRRGDLVLDPFGGSGTTLIACEENGRVCRTMEMDEHYCDVIVGRYVESTARQDVYLLRDGAKKTYAEAMTEAKRERS